MRNRWRQWASIAVMGVLFHLGQAGWSGTPEPFASMERAIQESQNKLSNSLIRIRVYLKGGGGSRTGQPASDMKPGEASGVAISASEVLVQFVPFFTRQQIEKVEMWWDGKWQAGVVVGEDRRLGFTVLKSHQPQGWAPVRWQFRTPESNRWAMGVVNGGEGLNFKTIANPAWIWGYGKDPNGDILLLGWAGMGPFVLATFDGEVLAFCANGAGRWIDEKYAKAIEAARETAMDDPTAMTGEDARSAWFGMVFMPMAPAYVEAMKVPTKLGVRIQGIVPGGPVAKSDMKVTDIILKFNGKEFQQFGDGTMDELRNAMKGAKPNEAAKFTVWRDGHEVDIKVIPEKRPVPKEARSEELGLKVAEILPVSAYLDQMPTSKGVMVTQTESGGPAAHAKIYPANAQYQIPMMILTEIGGVSITQLSDFYAALTKVRESKIQQVFVKGYRGVEYFMTVIDLSIGAKRSGSGGSDPEDPSEEGQP